MTIFLQFTFPSVIGVSGFFLGGLDTASNSLVIYMLGPERSPPWTQVSYIRYIFIILRSLLRHTYVMNIIMLMLVLVAARYGGCWFPAWLLRDQAVPA